ncbi:MAG TPA: RcnB family protein [Terracidiphilus sp.]|jgi:Ni/Co efflux regulator RcnB
MTRFHRALAIAALAATTLGGTAFSQDHHDDRDRDHHDEHHAYVHHDEWRKGANMRHEDWDRGARVDYRTYHLRRPPHGYEWREVDGNYVLAAVATGLIASVVVASTVH